MLALFHLGESNSIEGSYTRVLRNLCYIGEIVGLGLPMQEN